MVQVSELNNNEKPGWRKRLFRVGTTWLTHPRLWLHLAILAMILTLPALWVGWQMDDYFQRLGFLESSRRILHSLKLPLHILLGFSNFNFNAEGLELNRLYKDIGILPWWAPLNFQISFLRYLSTLDMQLDYWLWPNWPSLMHLHSLLWYAALVAATTILYKRILGTTWVAGLAALLYAVDEAHAFPVAWLANRNALLSVFFGVLSLLAYDGWRRMGKKWLAFACPALLALALLSGEMGLAAAGYLLAYALFLDHSRLSRRFLALWPCGAVLLSWALIYFFFGFGTKGSGMYIDPLGSPVEFAKAFFLRSPLLLLGQWSPLPADIGAFFSRKILIVLCFALIAILAFILLPLIRKDRVARFWFLGMLLSLVPIAGTMPSNRLLLFVGLGAMGLMAQFLSDLFDFPSILPSSRIWRIPALTIGAILIFSHLVISPLYMLRATYTLKTFGDFFTAPIKSVPHDPQIAHQDLVLVNPPDYIFSVNLLRIIKLLEGKPYPKRIRALSAGPVPIEIRRLDERSLQVSIRGGLFKGQFGLLYRSPEEPLTIDQEIQMVGLSARVTHLDKKYGPDEIVYRFSVPLEDPSLRWLQWEKGSYVPFILPSIGRSIRLSAGNPMDAFLRR